MEGLDAPFDVPPLAFTGTVRREAAHDPVLGVAAVELTHDQRLGVAGSVLEQALEIVFLVSVLDALTNAQELFGGAARGTQGELDHRMHDRALERR